jgi:hypothetical protein
VSDPARSLTLDDLGDLVWGVFGPLLFAIILGGGVLVWTAGGIQKVLLSFKYGAKPGDISIEDKPHDCDFIRAPLGDKGCHYDPVVASGYNSAGVLVMVMGKPVSPEYRTFPLTRFTVSWVKVTE